MQRTLAQGVKGEELNLLIGSRPFKDDKVSNKVKLNIMNILFEKYGIKEDDFLSAELEVVPAFKSCDIGFDRYMERFMSCIPAQKAAVEGLKA